MSPVFVSQGFSLVLVLYNFIVVKCNMHKDNYKRIEPKAKKYAYQGLFPRNSNSAIFQHYTPLSAYQVYVP